MNSENTSSNVNQELGNFSSTSATISFSGRMCSVLKVSISYCRSFLSPFTYISFSVHDVCITYLQLGSVIYIPDNICRSSACTKQLVGVMARRSRYDARSTFHRGISFTGGAYTFVSRLWFSSLRGYKMVHLTRFEAHVPAYTLTNRQTARTFSHFTSLPVHDMAKAHWCFS